MNTRFQHAYVLNVLSDDHPGIIAAVGGAISRLGGNIDACSQTVLHGYFTQILIVSLPRAMEADALAAEVSGGGADGLQVIARPLSAAASEPAEPARRFVVTAFGKDKPGIIFHVCRYLAGKDINISDFYWERAAGGGDEFVLISQVEIPPSCEFGALQADLEEIGRQEGFTVKLQHENIFVATNELRLTR